MTLAVLTSSAVGAVLVALGLVLLWLDRHGWDLALPSAAGLFSGGAVQLIVIAAGAAHPELAPVGSVALAAAQAGLMAFVGAACCLALAGEQRIECPSAGAQVGLSFGVGVAVSGVVFEAVSAGAMGVPEAASLTLVAAAAGTVVGAAVGWSKLHTPLLERVALIGGGVVVGAAVATGLRILDEVSSGAGQAGWPYVAAVATAVLGGLMVSVVHLEGRIIRRELSGEVALAQLPEWVLEVVPRYRRRIAGDWWPERSERRAVLQVLCRLCWRRARLAGLPEEAARVYGLEVGRLRQRARALVALAPEPTAPVDDQ